MAAFEQVLKNAVTDFTTGDLKNGYENYLKAAFTLILQLSDEVVFEDKNRVTSLPNHVYNLFTLSHKCLQTAEDIIRNWSIHSPDTYPFSSQEGGVTNPSLERENVITIETTLPLIPLSPLTQMSIIHSSSLASASHKLALSKHSKSSTASEVLHRLTEDVNIHRSNLDTVNAQVQSVTDVLITTWSPDAVAKQLTIIEAQLFAKVVIPDDLLSSETQSTRIQGCLDLHKYVESSFAHQIIAGSEVSSNFPEVHREDIIVHMIRTAYLLLHAYRNFNSFVAVMKALTNPEVRRLNKSWKLVPRKLKQTLNELMVHMHPKENYRGYRALFESVLQENDQFDAGMIGIPWMERHVETIQNIIQIYSTGQRGEYGPTISPEGANRLEYMLEILTQLQSNQSKDPQASPRQRTMGRKVLVEMNDSTIQVEPPLDLQSINGSDLGLHHWLLSRVFINRYQLWEESVEYQGLFKNEIIPIFLKDNQPVEVDITDQMRDQEELHEITDLETFDQFFPKEGEIPVMDLEQMESVDEILTFLDQEVVEQSQHKISSKEKAELFVHNFHEFDPSSPLSPLPSSLKIQDMSQNPIHEEEMNEKVQDVLDNISIPSIDEAENKHMDVDSSDLSPALPTINVNTAQSSPSIYSENLEEAFDEQLIILDEVPNEAEATPTTVSTTPIAKSEKTFAINPMDDVDNPWDSFLGDFESDHFLVHLSNDGVTSDRGIFRESRTPSPHREFKFQPFEGEIHSTPKPPFDTKSPDHTALLDSSWMHSELPIPTYQPYNFNPSQSSSMVQEMDEQELNEIFQEMVGFDEEVRDLNTLPPVIIEEEEPSEEEKILPEDGANDENILAVTETPDGEFDYVRDKEMVEEEESHMVTESSPNPLESEINFTVDEELMSDYHPEDFEAISEDEEFTQEPNFDSQDPFVDPALLMDKVEDVYEETVDDRHSEEEGNTPEDYSFEYVSEISSPLTEIKSKDENEIAEDDEFQDVASLRSTSEDSFPEESPEAIVAQLMMGVEAFRSDFASGHDSHLQSDHGIYQVVEEATSPEVAEDIQVEANSPLITELDTSSNEGDILSYSLDRQLEMLVAANADSLMETSLDGDENISPFNDSYAIQDQLTNDDDLRTVIPSVESQEKEYNNSEISVGDGHSMNDGSEISSGEGQLILVSERGSTGEQSMETSYVSISGYQGMTLADELGLSPIMIESIQIPNAEFLCDILDSPEKLAESELALVASLDAQVAEENLIPSIPLSESNELQVSQVADLLGLEGSSIPLNVDSFLSSLFDLKFEEPKVFEAFGENEPMPERLEHKKEVLSKKVERPPKGELLSEILRNDFGVMKGHLDIQNHDPRLIQVTQDFLSLLGTTPPLERLIELNNLLYRNISRESDDLPSTSKSWPPHMPTSMDDEYLEMSSTMGQAHSEPEMDDHMDTSSEISGENESNEIGMRVMEDREVDEALHVDEYENTESPEIIDAREDGASDTENIDFINPNEVSPFDDSFMLTGEKIREDPTLVLQGEHPEVNDLLIDLKENSDSNGLSSQNLEANLEKQVEPTVMDTMSDLPQSLQIDSSLVATCTETRQIDSDEGKPDLEAERAMEIEDLEAIHPISTENEKSYMYLVSDSEDEGTDAEPLIEESMGEQIHLIPTDYENPIDDLKSRDETSLIEDRSALIIEDDEVLMEDQSDAYVPDSESMISDDDLPITSISLNDLIRLNDPTYEDYSDFEIFLPERSKDEAAKNVYAESKETHPESAQSVEYPDTHFSEGGNLLSLNDIIRLQEPNFENLTISEKAERVLKSMESIESLSSKASRRKPRESSRALLSEMFQAPALELNSHPIPSANPGELINIHSESLLKDDNSLLKTNPLDENLNTQQASLLSSNEAEDKMPEWIDQVSNEDFDSEVDDIPVEFVSLVDLIKLNKSEKHDGLVPSVTSDDDDLSEEIPSEFLSLDMLVRLNQQSSDEEASSESEESVSKRSDEQGLILNSINSNEDVDTETDFEDIPTKSVSLELLLQWNNNSYSSEDESKAAIDGKPIRGHHQSMQHPESESELTSMTDNEPAEFLSLQKLRDLNELDTDSDGLASFIASKLSDSEASDHRRKRSIKLLSENIPALTTPAKSLSLQKLIGLNESIEEPTFSTDDDLPRIRKRSKRNRRKASKSQKPIGSVTQEIAII